MRISTIKNKIIFNTIASAILVGIVGFGIYYNLSFAKDSNSKIDKIKSEIIKINQEKMSLESQAAEFNKYTQLWYELPDLQKTIEGIKSSKVNKTIDDLSKKHLINKIDISLTIPEELKSGIFRRSTIKVMHSRVEMKFSSLTDVKAIGFINDFLSTLSGHKVVTKLSIKRGKKYLKDDFQKISLGQHDGNIETKATIHWYAYEDK